MTCVHCDHSLDSAATRPAFDPWLGRLWRVCPQCSRWNVVPLEDRWEALESLERDVRDSGRSLLRTEHLDLVRVGAGEVIRVGRAPRPELALWRYGDALPAPGPRTFREWLRRLLLGLPSSPYGYDTSEMGVIAYPFDAAQWFASPFLEDAPALTALFGGLPLAPRCPACERALIVAASGFQHVRLTLDRSEPAVAARCARCREEVLVPVAAARPALRLGLFVVNRRLRSPAVVTPAAEAVERTGPEGLLQRVAGAGDALGETASHDRLALQIALDEAAEAELLEGEWREAEELAAIIDGELADARGLRALKDGLAD